jgi:hypothetical protein
MGCFTCKLETTEETEETRRFLVIKELYYQVEVWSSSFHSF